MGHPFRNLPFFNNPDAGGWDLELAAFFLCGLSTMAKQVCLGTLEIPDRIMTPKRGVLLLYWLLRIQCLD